MTWLNTDPIRIRAETLLLSPRTPSHKAENILGISAAPDTSDVFVNLDRNFQSLIADKLSQSSRHAVMEQQDPSTLTEADRDRILGEIMQAVFGKFME